LSLAETMEHPLVAIDQSSQALVVGVSRYQYLHNLRATRDAQGVRDVLASPEYCAYPPERVQLIEEEAASRDSVLRALDALGDGAQQAGSRTFFYFSGHGGQGPDGSSCILPVDARHGQYPSTAISARDLASRLDHCSGEVTVVLDCCYAAGMTSREVSAPAGPSDVKSVELAGFGDAFRRDIQSRGRVVFAASRPDDYAFASPVAPYGIFTGHMLDGLHGKASTDGYDVTVYQLFDYVQKHVTSSSMGMQRPSFIANIEEFYRLTRYPRRIAPSVVFEKDVYISYDRTDRILRAWVEEEFEPELKRGGRTIWDHDDLGNMELDVENAITKSKYVVVLLTASYLRSRLDELKTTMAILQAVHTRTPRFIPILRERCDVPLTIKAFVGLDMSEWNQMEFRYSMDRLIKRLKKEPHER
jgi:Caspase domain/TIR domain